MCKFFGDEFDKWAHAHSSNPKSSQVVSTRARKFKSRQVTLQFQRIASVVKELLSYGLGCRSDRTDYVFGFAYAREHPGLAICTWCCSTVSHRIPTRHLLFVWRCEGTAHVVFVNLIGSDGSLGTRGWILRVSALPSQ